MAPPTSSAIPTPTSIQSRPFGIQATAGPSGASSPTTATPGGAGRLSGVCHHIRPRLAGDPARPRGRRLRPRGIRIPRGGRNLFAHAVGEIGTALPATLELGLNTAFRDDARALATLAEGWGFTLFQERQGFE